MGSSEPALSSPVYVDQPVRLMGFPLLETPCIYSISKLNHVMTSVLRSALLPCVRQCLWWHGVNNSIALKGRLLKDFENFVVPCAADHIPYYPHGSPPQ